jgi:hypothetical protein
MYSLVHLSFLASQVWEFAISNKSCLATFLLYIEGAIISMNLLGEASLAMINALNIINYASLNSMNSPIHEVFPLMTIFHFLIIGPFSGAL